MKLKKILLADDDILSMHMLFRLRLPSLVIGLFLGFILSFATSRFEEVLARSVEVAFFIPFIVYMAAAVGNQTQTIYARDMERGRARFGTYLIKEIMLGILFGSVFGVVSLVVVWMWFRSMQLALTVGVAMAIAIYVAPVVAIIVTRIIQLRRQDPAVGSGPLTTVITDTISVLIYGTVASIIMGG